MSIPPPSTKLNTYPLLRDWRGPTSERALALLKLRLQSRLKGPLLVFQSLFLVGMGLIVVYLYLAGLPGGISRATAAVLRSWSRHALLGQNSGSVVIRTAEPSLVAVSTVASSVVV